jgi:hypothetical protein
MRYNNESAGEFIVYEVIGHADVDDAFLDRLYKNYFQTIGMEQRDMMLIKDAWNQAKNRKDNTISNGRSIQEAISFYENEVGKINEVIEQYLKSKRNRKKIIPY